MASEPSPAVSKATQAAGTPLCPSRDRRTFPGTSRDGLGFGRGSEAEPAGWHGTEAKAQNTHVSPTGAGSAPNVGFKVSHTAPWPPQVTGRGLSSWRDLLDRTLGLEQWPRRPAEQELPSERGFLSPDGARHRPRSPARPGVILGRGAALALCRLPAPSLRKLEVPPGRGAGDSMAVTQSVQMPMARDG